MAEKSGDLLYVAELVLSEDSVRKLPLNNAIKHIKNNLEARYLKPFLLQYWGGFTKEIMFFPRYFKIKLLSYIV